jgi:hypothetical protein
MLVRNLLSKYLSIAPCGFSLKSGVKIMKDFASEVYQDEHFSIL